jgi:hypothetical protein
MEEKSKLDSILEDARQLGDELQLKISLGKAEAKDEFAELESKYGQLKANRKKIAEVAGDTAEELRIAAEMGFKSDSKEDVETAFELAAEELKKGYEKIKKLL